MASFREHIAFSSLVGIGYGAAAMALFGFKPAEATLAGFLAAIGGMLPDLDSPNARPGQEIFGVTAALAPLVLIGHVIKAAELPPDTETVMVLMLAIYFSVRYGLAWFVNKVSVHRGMFHSIPAMIIAAQLTYMAYPSPRPFLKLLMACGVALGFFSHLLLDEVYSVKWHGPIPQLKKSFGTAIKFSGKAFGANAFTYVLLGTLLFLICEQEGIIGPPIDGQNPPVVQEGQKDAALPVDPEGEALQSLQEARLPNDELPDAPLFR